jgi:HPt (histidine-containing phosphotransfer) domain-containing protein
LRQAAASADLEQIARHSHSLKGIVGPLGADNLAHLLLEIEQACENRQNMCDEKKLTEIDVELNHVRREMQEFIAA